MPYTFDVNATEDIMRDLAQNLKKRRLEKKITREALSKLSHVPTATIAKFEQKHTISLTSFVALAKALGYTHELKQLLSEPLFSSLLMSDYRLRSIDAFGQYIDQEDGSTEFFRELEAEEYCPELNYVLLTGGHGYVSIYDLKTLERIYTNPSTHVYSPSGKYRFGTFEFDGMSFYIEMKEGRKYVPYLLAASGNEYYISGVYWHDDETMHYLIEKKGAGDSIYWIGYSAKLFYPRKH